MPEADLRWLECLMPGCDFITPPFPRGKAHAWVEDADAWFRDFHQASHPGYDPHTVAHPDSLDMASGGCDRPDGYRRMHGTTPVPRPEQISLGVFT